MIITEAHREEAEAMARGEPPEWAWFCWLENKLQAAGNPPTPAWWQDTYLDFVRTCKRTFYAGAGLRSQKSSATTIFLLSETLFRRRKSIMGAPFVLPIIAAGKPEAGGRVMSIRTILKILGFRERERVAKGEGADLVDPGEYLYSYSPYTGDGFFALRDVSGNMVQIQTKVASLAGVREYTGIGGMFDEADHVPLEAEGGGAHDILDYLQARTTGQDGARIYVISNPTDERSLLSSACIAGDQPGSYIARLGAKGAQRDQEQRTILADFLAMNGEIGLANDKRLHEPADPKAWRIPTWAVHFPILECWERACDSASRRGEVDKLGTLFRIFGARSVGGEGGRYFDFALCQSMLDPDRIARWETTC